MNQTTLSISPINPNSQSMQSNKLSDNDPPANEVESYISGEFSGWTGNTMFALDNGQIWQQSRYSYLYHYAFHPKVLIYMAGGCYMMKVEDVDETICVQQIQ